jgi:hypothetical protein
MGVPDPGLERSRRRLTRPAKWFWLLGLVLLIPGVLLFVLGRGWAAALGIALVALSVPPLVVAIGLGASGAVAWWVARRKPLA